MSLPTQEVINGQRITINDNFRVYHNDTESFDDFGNLIRNSGIYNSAVSIWDSTHDPKRFIQAVGTKYATDPNWANAVASIAGYAQGAYVPDEHLLVSAATGRIDGRMAEAGGEFIVPAGGFAAAGIGGATYTFDLRGSQAYDGRSFQDLIIGALSKADRQGRITFIGPNS